MAIKIPRGDIPAPSVGNRGSSVLSAVQSNKIDYNKVTDTLDFIGTKIATHNAKIRNEEIKNKNAVNKSLLTADKDDFIFNIQENKTLNTEGDYFKEFDNWSKKTLDIYEKKYKNEPDSRAFDEFQSDLFNLINVDAKKELRTARKRKILIQTEVNHDISKKEFKSSVSKLPVNENIFVAKNLLVLKEERRQGEVALILGAGKVNTVELKEYADQTTWENIIKTGKEYYSDMDDKMYIDYQKVQEELRTEKGKTYFGEKIDPDRKEKLIDWAGKKEADQKTYFKGRDARLDVDNSKTINSNMDNWINGANLVKLNGKDVPAETYFNATIPTLKITVKQKDALYAKVEEIAKDKKAGAGTDALGDPVAFQEYYNKIIIGQARDAQFTIDIMQDKRLNPKGQEWLLNHNKKWTNELDEFAKTSINALIKPYERDVNEMSKLMDKYNPAGINILGNLSRQVKLTAWRLLAEGEKSGISYDQMLNDIESPHYIGFKLEKIYAISAVEASKISMEKNFDVQKFWSDRRNKSLEYFIDADTNTEGLQLYQGFKTSAEGEDGDGFLTGKVTTQPVGTPAIYLKRRLDKPKKPTKYRLDGTEIPIGEYATSKEMLKYEKDNREWFKKGGFNSQNIPSILKSTLGFSDISKTPKNK
jgi:hypothetical protein